MFGRRASVFVCNERPESTKKRKGANGPTDDAEQMQSGIVLSYGVLQKKELFRGD